METSENADPDSKEQYDTFFRWADELEEALDEQDDSTRSKQHNIIDTDISRTAGPDTMESQRIVADEVDQYEHGGALEDTGSGQAGDNNDSVETLSDDTLDGSTRAAPGQSMAKPQFVPSQVGPTLPARPGLKGGDSNSNAAIEAAQAEDGGSLRGKLEVLDGVPPRPGQGPMGIVADAQEGEVNSLTLGQLKKLMEETPKAPEAPSYAFQYADSSSLEEELEELFDYTKEERALLVEAQRMFASRWEAFKYKRVEANWVGDPPRYSAGRIDWEEDEDVVKLEFLNHLKDALMGDDAAARSSALLCALYLALGCWVETAVGGRAEDVAQEETDEEQPFGFAETQKYAIISNVRLIGDTIGVDRLCGLLEDCYGSGEEFESSRPTTNGNADHPDHMLQDRNICFILLHLMVDVASRDRDLDEQSIMRHNIIKLNPPLLHRLSGIMVRSRWDDTEFIPPSKLLSLYWKTILLTFGGTDSIAEIKETLAGEQGGTRKDQLYTASPLDYHLFRQEITSKYPAFDPPPPLFPFEPDSSSIIPPLSDPSRSDSISNKNGEAGPGNIQPQNTSIMQQPVHIATPAPSPPPSPAGPGGKVLKKQNYQTNQMFPFMYPPLDEYSNDLGGRGTTELQDLLAGRKWQGRDIPASILEAAELFSKRMRATRGMKQLWQERVKFLRFERGQEDVDDFDLNGIDGPEAPPAGEATDLDALTEDQRQRLQAVEDFYDDVLPRLQSLVIVLLKVLLQAITILITQPQGVNGLPSGDPPAGENSQQKPGISAQVNGMSEESDDKLLNDLIALRSQEITGKAVSGILILMLKWFRLSHILKFEYLSQLLLDNQYIQLVLKLFSHQELERIVNFRCERKELNFFTWCRTQSRHAPPARTDTGSTNASAGSAISEDQSPSPEAALPPPIPLRREPKPVDDSILQAVEEFPAVTLTRSPQPNNVQPAHPSGQSQPPEVDELGHPTNLPPLKPITHYSWRTFFTSINHLRILQKLIKGKPHRQLLMVQSKYSLTLKKQLRVPHDTLRLYILKIIKGQVPYCHRKWRQSNMRIITAIYMEVRPGLREEWLSGLDVEAEIGEALPMEQALRALTWWWHLRSFPDQMGLEGKRSSEEAPVSGYVGDLLDEIERKEIEEDEKLVDSILGSDDDDPGEKAVQAALNGNAGVTLFDADGTNDQDEDIWEDVPNGIDLDGMNLAEEALLQNGTSTADAFDIDYDPFTSSGHEPNTGDNSSPPDPLLNATPSSNQPSPAKSPSHLQPPLDPIAAFISSGSRRNSSASRNLTGSGSNRSSRRPSLKETLLGDPDPDDDFFLRELEKMDLSDRFSAMSAGSSRAGSLMGSRRSSQLDERVNVAEMNGERLAGAGSGGEGMRIRPEGYSQEVWRALLDGPVPAQSSSQVPATASETQSRPQPLAQGRRTSAPDGLQASSMMGQRRGEDEREEEVKSPRPYDVMADVLGIDADEYEFNREFDEPELEGEEGEQGGEGQEEGQEEAGHGFDHDSDSGSDEEDEGQGQAEGRMSSAEHAGEEAEDEGCDSDDEECYSKYGQRQREMAKEEQEEALRTLNRIVASGEERVP